MSSDAMKVFQSFPNPVSSLLASLHCLMPNPSMHKLYKNFNLTETHVKLFLNFKRFRNFLLTGKFKCSEKFQTFTHEINTFFYQWSRTKPPRENLFSEWERFYFSSVKITEMKSAVLINFQSRKLNPLLKRLALKKCQTLPQNSCQLTVVRTAINFCHLPRKTCTQNLSRFLCQSVLYEQSLM